MPFSGNYGVKGVGTVQNETGLVGLYGVSVVDYRELSAERHGYFVVIVKVKGIWRYAVTALEIEADVFGTIIKYTVLRFHAYLPFNHVTLDILTIKYEKSKYFKKMSSIICKMFCISPCSLRFCTVQGSYSPGVKRFFTFDVKSCVKRKRRKTLDKSEKTALFIKKAHFDRVIYSFRIFILGCLWYNTT